MLRFISIKNMKIKLKNINKQRFQRVAVEDRKMKTLKILSYNDLNANPCRV
jgi:hypothetical protein